MSSSISSPFFLANAEDLLRRLGPLASPDAQRLAVEARELIATFRDWAVNRPTDEVRVKCIGQLFELNRRAMDFMAKQAPPASGGRPPPSSGPVSSGRASRHPVDDEDR